MSTKPGFRGLARPFKKSFAIVLGGLCLVIASWTSFEVSARPLFSFTELDDPSRFSEALRVVTGMDHADRLWRPDMRVSDQSSSTKKCLRDAMAAPR